MVQEEVLTIQVGGLMVQMGVLTVQKVVLTGQEGFSISVDVAACLSRWASRPCCQMRIDL